MIVGVSAGLPSCPRVCASAGSRPGLQVGAAWHAWVTAERMVSRGFGLAGMQAATDTGRCHFKHPRGVLLLVAGSREGPRAWGHHPPTLRQAARIVVMALTRAAPSSRLGKTICTHARTHAPRGGVSKRIPPRTHHVHGACPGPGMAFCSSVEQSCIKQGAVLHE